MTDAPAPVGMDEAVIDARDGLRTRTIARMPRPSSLAIIGMFVVICIVGATTTGGFATAGNVRSILTSSAFVGTIAVGMTVIMLSGNLFSLSLGTTAAITAMSFLFALQFGIVPAVLLTLLLGAAICAVQGVIVGAFGANPIIVTIAAGLVEEGVTLGVTGGRTVYPPGMSHAYAGLTHNVGGVPVPFLVFVGAVVAVDLILRGTRFGKAVYALGDNERAARAAAFSVPAVTTGVFAVAGVATAAAGILLGAFNQNASLLLEGTYTFDAIAAALVGGTAVTGGRGSAARTLFGAVVIATVSSLLLLHGYSTGMQILVKGAIVIIVVAVVRLGGEGGRR